MISFRFPILCSLLFLSLVLVSCGGAEISTIDSTELIVGNAGLGQQLYQRTVLGAASAPGCTTCHSLDAEITLVGPSHAGLAERASGVVAGKSAEEYLRESIIDVNAHITEGFKKGVMYTNYGRDLSEQEIADLIAFLLTLK